MFSRMSRRASSSTVFTPYLKLRSWVSSRTTRRQLVHRVLAVLFQDTARPSPPRIPPPVPQAAECGDDAVELSQTLLVVLWMIG